MTEDTFREYLAHLNETAPHDERGWPRVWCHHCQQPLGEEAVFVEAFVIDFQRDELFPLHPECENDWRRASERRLQSPEGPLA